MGIVADIDLKRVVTAGAAASTAYLVAMALDMRLLRYPQNDLILLGRLPPFFDRVWPLIGLTMHVSFGILLAFFHAVEVRQHLPGPPWLRGILLALIENTLLWPLVIQVDRFHPPVRDGQMPPMSNLRCFSQATLRHVAFGAVLGSVYGQQHASLGEQRA